MSGEKTIQEKLAENAIQVDRFILENLEPRKPEVLYNASRHLIEAGGKRLRPFLVMKTCEAVGGDTSLAVPFAAALELMHNFTLVHDDVMDNDSLRRGNPTVHVKYGSPIAIAAGDLLFGKVYESMLNHSEKVDIERVLACVKSVTDATIILCEGQVLDLIYPGSDNVSEEDYILMVEGKTSALFKACAEVGALVGGGSDSEVKALGQAWWDAGVAFQLIDDVLGVTADEKTLGKPVGSDIKEGKKTMIVIHALNNATSSQRSILLNVLGNRSATKNEISEAMEILKEIGSIDYTISKAKEYRDSAISGHQIIPESQAKKELVDLITFFVNRNY
jgi:geranylgeranyl diphosphate synthase type I